MTLGFFCVLSIGAASCGLADCNVVLCLCCDWNAGKDERVCVF